MPGITVINAKYEEFKTWEPGMKFDVVVGNPPYSFEGGSYVNFVDLANSLSTTTAMVIPTSYFFDVRKFRGVRIYKNIDLKTHFPTVDISGICYFVTGDNHKTVTLIDQDNNSTIVNEVKRVFGCSAIEYSILNKVAIPTGGYKSYTGVIQNDVAKQSASNSGTFVCLAVGSNDTPPTLVRLKDISGVSGLGNIKVCFTMKNDSKYVNHAIVLDETVGVSSQVMAVNFKTRDEAENFVSLINTKLGRMTLSALLAGANKLKRSMFDQFPVLDLSKSWADQDLYIHFGLTEEEIKYIEETVK